MNLQGITYSEDQWSILEKKFNPNYLGKCEVTMALGNGYMGLRSTTEERYLEETRNAFIAGTFNKAGDNEVTELPNIPDFLEMNFLFNGENFSLTKGEIIDYERRLNLKSGELTRSIQWERETCGSIDLCFKRFVSSKDLNLVAQKVIIRPKDQDLNIQLLSGINGQVTNSGAQHFQEGTKRLYDQIIMHQSQKTTESNIDIYINTMHQLSLNHESVTGNMLIGMDRRKIFGNFDIQVLKGSSVEITKYTLVGTSRDKQYIESTSEARKEDLIDQIRQYEEIPYEILLHESEVALNEKLWSKVKIDIESEEKWDLVATRFAQYHLHIMMPAHDNRMGIGAKGFTGEGYKGHSFWDTEVFMFPYFLYTQPQLARQLLEYRYLTLAGARQKAYDNGYLGAQFPWESAWLDDGEVTPVWGAADIVTGKSTKIWSGFIEQHISADIAFAIYQYFNVSGDQEFMEDYGYEMLFETAIFWASRLEDGEDGKLHINNVIGPDEYKEHINDNAFTNYLVKLNFDLAINYTEFLIRENIDLFNDFNKKLDLTSQLKIWAEKSRDLYLPVANNEKIIPQDSTYLSKELIDLSKYKNQEHVGSIFKDYNLEQVNNIQVSKQADIMMLFYLRENLFSKEVKQANWTYYESKTLHDSSLSLSTHAIIANDLGDYPLSYDLYTKCREIDLGPNMISSDHGIHAASLGGMLQVVMNGYGGIRVLNGKLRIEPKLPKTWSKLDYDFHWKGDQLNIVVSKDQLRVTNLTKNNEVIEFSAFGASYLLSESTKVTL